MTKKILSASLLMVCVLAFFSCKKKTSPAGDPTRQYFSIKFGKSVIYNLDPIYYFDTTSKQVKVTSQEMYSIIDTFRNSGNRLSNIMKIHGCANANAT